MDLEEVLEQLSIREPLRVEDDLDRLGMTPWALLAGIVALAAGPSHAGGDDPVGVAQQLLHDPRALSREDSGLGVVAHACSFLGVRSTLLAGVGPINLAAPGR